MEKKFIWLDSHYILAGFFLLCEASAIDSWLDLPQLYKYT